MLLGLSPLFLRMVQGHNQPARAVSHAHRGLGQGQRLGVLEEKTGEPHGECSLLGEQRIYEIDKPMSPLGFYAVNKIDAIFQTADRVRILSVYLPQ